MIADTVAIAVVQAIVFTTGLSRRGKLTVALSRVSITCSAVVALFANLSVSQIIKEAGIVRARDVGAVNSSESIITDAKVILADPASRAIFRAGRGEILPQIIQLFVAILLTIVVWSLDPKVWIGTENWVAVLVHINATNRDLAVTGGVVLSVPLPIDVVDTVHIRHYLALCRFDVTCTFQTPVSSKNKGTTSLLRGASAELRCVANGHHSGPVSPRGIFTLAFNFDPGVA